MPADTNLVTGRVHYIPHHPVIRLDKETTKVRIVYDPSARKAGSSLNDCLHTGPSLIPEIMDILIRFRYHKVALVSDVEKAFHQVSIAPEDRDMLCFLWIDNAASPEPRIVVYRFTRAVFGVNCSPFLLNASISHHIQQYSEDLMWLTDRHVEQTTLGQAEPPHTQDVEPSTVVEDESTYAKLTYGSTEVLQDPKQQKLLGTNWNLAEDEPFLDLSYYASFASSVPLTKRAVLRFMIPSG